MRARSLPELNELVARVKDIAAGAALMTGTTVRSEIIIGDANLVCNTPLEALMHDNLKELGPPESGDGTSVGSTDVGTVSWVVPTVQMRGATYAIGTPGHSWQLVAQGKLSAAHKGMVHASKIMASTAVDLLSDPALIEKAKADHRERLDGTPFVNPIPDDVMPPLPKQLSA